MRPINLKISAFGPYAGEVEIPMENLGAEGLYLITGDTGAGKTTIFDAICFALFGEASGDNRENSMLRSKYANETTATEVELVFLHSDKIYTIKRSPEYLRPSKNGKLTKHLPEAALTMPDGSSVSKIKEVNAKITELLGIDKDQFSQIVMIAQGDFMKLLMADTKQRQEIFRSLFKTVRYQRLQLRLEEKRKEIYGQVQDGIKSRSQYLSGIKVETDNAQLSLEVDRAKNEGMNHEEVLELLNKLIEADAETKKSADKEIEQIKSDIESINIRIGKAETVEKAWVALEENKKKLISEESNEKELKEIFDKTSLEYTKKDQLVAKIAKIEVEINTLEAIANTQREVTVKKEEVESEKVRIRKTEADRVALVDKQKRLSEELLGIKDVSTQIVELNNELEKKKELINELKELISDNNSYKSELIRLKKAQEKYVEDEKICRELTHKYDDMEVALRNGQAGILAEQLIEGECCPVCGSKSHPVPAHRSDSIPTEEEIKTAKKQADNAREVANASSNSAGSIKTSVELKKSNLLKEAAKFFESIDAEKIDELINSRLEDVNVEIKSINNQLEEVGIWQRRKEEIELELPKITDSLGELDQRLSKLSASLSAMKASIKEKEENIEKLSKNITFKDISTAKSKKDEITAEVMRLQSCYDDAQKKWNASKTEIASLRSSISSYTETVEGAENIDLDAEQSALEKLKEKENEQLIISSGADLRIKTNSDILNNVNKVSGDIVEIEKKLEMVTALANTANGKITGKGKMMLETYIQTTYFDRIIDRANKRLNTMSNGKYDLKRQSEADNQRSQSGLELSVIDHYNGTERSVKTLSGGESFMASLSLALGLSDEVTSSAGGIRIDTMFVDEGFGSLDANSLDQAYKALSGLTNGNRLVGIISHVAELKNKIDKQIVVKKEKTGGSNVKLMC